MATVQRENRPHQVKSAKWVDVSAGEEWPLIIAASRYSSLVGETRSEDDVRAMLAAGMSVRVGLNHAHAIRN